jgi:hypothetical protein
MALSITDLITPQYIKDTFILGVDLTLDDGSPYPDIIFETAINQAIAMIEIDLDIKLDPVIIENERHDADTIDTNAHWPIHLDNKPLRKVTGLQLQLGNNEPSTIPPQWATVSSFAQSMLKIIPTSQTYDTPVYRDGQLLLIGDVFSPYRRFPDYIGVSYEAGFTYEEGSFTIPAGSTTATVQFQEKFNDTKPTIKFSDASVRLNIAGGSSMRVSIPVARVEPLIVEYTAYNVDPLILRAISLLAAMLPLNIAGDLIAGAGIASQSLSIDGLSQSIATTASATSAGYGARIIQYQKELSQVMSVLRGEYSRVNFWAR